MTCCLTLMSLPSGLPDFVVTQPFACARMLSQANTAHNPSFSLYEVTALS